MVEQRVDTGGIGGEGSTTYMTPDEVTSSARLAGQVERYHTWPTIRRQSTAEHSWQVARIYTEIWGIPTANTLLYIMHHDTAELAVGDPPFPVKAQSSVLRDEYTRLEGEALEVILPSHIIYEMTQILRGTRLRVKACDLAEMTEFGIEEMRLGNRYGQPIAERTLEAAREFGRINLSGEDYGLFFKWTLPLEKAIMRERR